MISSSLKSPFLTIYSCNVTTMQFQTTKHLNENVLNSNFELLHALEIRQISVIQKL